MDTVKNGTSRNTENEDISSYSLNCAISHFSQCPLCVHCVSTVRPLCVHCVSATKDRKPSFIQGRLPEGGSSCDSFHFILCFVAKVHFPLAQARAMLPGCFTGGSTVDIQWAHSGHTVETVKNGTSRETEIEDINS